MANSAELIQAVKAGDAARVASILDTAPELVEARTESGVSAAAIASYQGQHGIARLFLERGLKPDIYTACAVGAEESVRASDPSLINSYSPDGFTPLALACYFDHQGIAEYLISAGADVNAVSRESMKIAPLHSAISRGSTRLVRLLLEKGADVNISQEIGFSPLHSAAAGGNREIIDLLIENGANPAAVMHDGNTPADLADSRGHKDLAAHLRSVAVTYT